jgi:GNAT superfamily N-acetyltransferase
MDDLVVRPVRNSDAEGLARAWNDSRDYYAELNPDAFRGSDPEDDGLGLWLVDQLRQAADDERRLVRVAECGGEAVGCVVARLEPPDPSAPRQLLRDLAHVRVSIDALDVQRRHWRSGIGTALVGAVEEWARAHEARLVKLTTYHHSPVSVPFYEALGYERRAAVFIKNL